MEVSFQVPAWTTQKMLVFLLRPQWTQASEASGSNRAALHRSKVSKPTKLSLATRTRGPGLETKTHKDLSKTYQPTLE